MEEMMTVNVRVGACLREYVISTRGGDVIVPAKDSVLWCLLKQHLVTSAFGYVPPDPSHQARRYKIPVAAVHHSCRRSAAGRNHGL